MPSESWPYDTAAIRERLNATLDGVELDALCLDHFPSVYEKFSLGMRKDAKLTLLLDYCRRNPDQWERLENLIQAGAGDRQPRRSDVGPSTAAAPDSPVTFVEPAPTSRKKPVPWWILLMVGAVLVGGCCLVAGYGLIVTAWPDGGVDGGGNGGGGGGVTVERRLVSWERGRPVPDLVVSWEMALNGMSYTLQLEQNVWLADGRAFNATTVKEVLDENMGRLAIVKVSIIDDYTIMIALTMADIDYTFLQKLSEITIATSATR